ncbi:hypothetical protein Taro_029694 [Colocasia esculenta]|uniref:Uncharacterized protein n=1 Tax=Colocasia esculenta TaxID=4460 RepID=A0A843VPS4_COLES|nr:hypothetical protein [Colocasia esculenta]
MFLWRVLKDKRLKIRSFLTDQSNVHQMRDNGSLTLKEDQLWLGVRIREGDSTLDSEILRSTLVVCQVDTSVLPVS